MKLTSKHLDKLLPALFPGNPGTQREFISSLESGKAGQPAVVWCNERPQDPPFAIHEIAPWQPQFISAIEPGSGAGRHPLHDQGVYYCLDFSSVFSASAMLAVKERPSTVLDLCAAPGGKSIFAWRALKPDLLIANEVIGKRTGALIGNFKRCSVAPAMVIRHDPTEIASRFAGSADLVLVDAPCSGQSLLGKGLDVPGAFNPLVVKMNAKRQRRILASAAETVRPGGHLLYMTCTFAPEENEESVAWLLKKRADFKAVPVPHLASHASALADFPCYRLFPFEGLGVGAFACLLRNEATDPIVRQDPQDLDPLWTSA